MVFLLPFLIVVASVTGRVCVLKIGTGIVLTVFVFVVDGKTAFVDLCVATMSESWRIGRRIDWPPAEMTTYFWCVEEEELPQHLFFGVVH